MTASNPSFRDPVARARGLGSAKHATKPWLTHQVTSIVLIPLSLYILMGLVVNVVLASGSFEAAQAWLAHPLNAFVVLLTIGVTIHHGLMGFQVIVEDYVHASIPRFVLIVGSRCAGYALGVAGAMAVIKVWLMY